MFGNCPTSCKLNPSPETSTALVDQQYLAALLRAVPDGGAAFTYTHFPRAKWAQKWRKHQDSGAPTTTINYSADSRQQAKASVKAGIPCVIAIPEDEAVKHERVDGVRYVQCPATYSAVTCESCGGGKPLCARADRDYVITFPAHGATKKRVGTKDKGGCYAAGGNVALHWRRLATLQQDTTDGEALLSFVAKLPAGKILRHHVAGDIGHAAIPVSIA
jgi:hypothetical protein